MPMVAVLDRNNRCYSFGSLFVGATGGTALGVYTKVFESKTPVDKLTIEMKSDFLKNHKYLKNLQQLQIGGHPYWRIGGQIIGSTILYSYLECKFLGGWPRRSVFDCVVAGAITGGAFGLRGFPGNKQGALVGAAGFGLYAGLIHLLFRR